MKRQSIYLDWILAKTCLNVSFILTLLIESTL